jgi:hypothetical protein
MAANGTTNHHAAALPYRLVLTSFNAVKIRRTRVLGRMGILDCTTHLHSLCALYTFVEDRLITNSDLG